MMTKKTMFRKVVDALVNGRALQAKRFIDDYIKERHHLKGPRQG